MEKNNILHRVGWLSTVPPEFRDALLAKCDLISVKSGVPVYRAGEEAGGLFGVLYGQVELHLLEVRDGQTLCHIGGPGYWFGEMAALSGARRLVDVMARSDCKLVWLNRSELHRLLEADPIAWSQVTLLVNSNLDLALRVIESLKQHDPALRVARCLQNLLLGKVEYPARIHVTQADVASIAGIARKTANSVLGAFEAKGFIEIGYGWIDIRVATSNFTDQVLNER